MKNLLILLMVNFFEDHCLNRLISSKTQVKNNHNGKFQASSTSTLLRLGILQISDISLLILRRKKVNWNSRLMSHIH